MIRYFTALSMAAMLAGCTTHTEQASSPVLDSSRNPYMLTPDLYPAGAIPEKEPAVRYGRYTWVSTEPHPSQRDLMAQIVDITIPANMSPDVREAMLYVMNRSGYSLCTGETGPVNILYSRPLPAALYKIGPMTLRNALQVLAGPAWRVEVDEVERQVCYGMRPEYKLRDTQSS
jgi:type IV pili sensor histidine kinase/response regulator